MRPGGGFRNGGDVVVPALALAALGLCLMLPLLGSYGLWDPWEPKYAQTPREMADRGDWVVPYYRQDARLVKPPLTYWFIGASQKVLGETEAAARLPSALLAVLCPVALCIAFCMHRRPQEGLLAGGALLASPQWLLAGRFATPDMPLAALLGVALAAGLAGSAARRASVRTACGFVTVVAIAGAGLTDWPRGLLLPAWALLAWGTLGRDRVAVAGLAGVAVLHAAGQHLVSAPLNLASIGLTAILLPWVLRRTGGQSIRSIAAGAGIVLILVAPWFVAVFQIEPAEALERLLGYKHGLNLGETPGRHTGGLHDPLRIVMVGSLVWCAAAWPGLVRAFRKERDPLATALGGAFLGYLLFFSLAEAKMGHFYVLLQPPLAALAAIGLTDFVRRRGWTAVPAVALLVTVALLVWDSPSAILGTVQVKRSLHGLIEPALPALLALGAWALVVGLAAWRRSERIALASVLPPLLFVGYLGFSAVPALSPKKSFAPLWESYTRMRGAGEPIGAYSTALNSGFYYSDNAIVRLKTGNALRGFLSGGGIKFVAMPRRALRDLSSALQRSPAARPEVVHDAHPSHVLVRFGPAQNTRSHAQ